MEYNAYTLIKCLHTLEEHPEHINCLTISSNGQILVSSCYEVIRVWDLSKGELICQSKHHKYTIGFRLIVNPDLETFITDYSGCIEISDLLTGEIFKRFQVRYSAALAITPDGKTLFVGGSLEDDKTISVWDCGECAQACRMTYELIADGETVELGDRKYLLSPQDLAGLEVLPDLVKSGVSCLKIEGRLKSPEYVANVTKVYRQALDSVSSHQLAVNSRREQKDKDKYNLEMAFSRKISRKRDGLRELIIKN